MTIDEMIMYLEDGDTPHYFASRIVAKLRTMEAQLKAAEVLAAHIENNPYDQAGVEQRVEAYRAAGKEFIG